MHDPIFRPPAEVIEALNAMKRMVCVGHVRPDADCLGSLLAVARAWSRTGACSTSVCLPEGSVSRRLAFMVELAGVRPASAEDFAAADGFFVADTARMGRCNVLPGLGDDWSAGRKMVNVDHHVTNTRFGDINWTVGGAASSSELILRVIQGAGREVDATIASLLYSGMCTDTVGFSTPATAGATLRAAAELVECGAAVGPLCERLNRSHGTDVFHLLRTIYANTHLVGDNRIAYSTASYDEITAAGCDASDIDDQVNVPRSLAGIEMAILFTEGQRGRTRLNFRGEQGREVVELARLFAGGGHAGAAGATLDCGVAEAVARVIPAAIKALDDGKGKSAKCKVQSAKCKVQNAKGKVQKAK